MAILNNQDVAICAVCGETEGAHGVELAAKCSGFFARGTTEVERLRAEVEKLTKERDETAVEYEARMDAIQHAFRGEQTGRNAAIERLATAEAQVEKLRAILEDRDADKRLNVTQAQEITRLRAELATREDRAVEWVDIHVSGQAAPNADDLVEMRQWIRGTHPYQRPIR